MAMRALPAEAASVPVPETVPVVAVEAESGILHNIKIRRID